MDDISDRKKKSSVFLNGVYNYMNRTIGVRFINSIADLEKTWEDTQFELSADYQYEGLNEHIWDYYLVFCCNFNENDIDKRLRFKIESDRFCCRKYFLFGMSKQAFSKEKLIDRLFPLVNSSKPIRMITPEIVLEQLDEEIRLTIPTSFLTEELNISEAESLLNKFIANIEEINGKQKNN